MCVTSFALIRVCVTLVLCLNSNSPEYTDHLINFPRSGVIYLLTSRHVTQMVPSLSKVCDCFPPSPSLPCFGRWIITFHCDCDDAAAHKTTSTESTCFPVLLTSEFICLLGEWSNAHRLSASATAIALLMFNPVNDLSFILFDHHTQQWRLRLWCTHDSCYHAFIRRREQ